MRAAPGTYALIFVCRQAASVDVGRLGKIDLARGYYVYVGSALGPGGVRARVARHWREDKRTHWHIDYLHDYLIPVEAWYRHGDSRDEHRWAESFARAAEMFAVPGFGASDCRCGSHLFHTVGRPTLASFRPHLGEQVRTATPA